MNNSNQSITGLTLRKILKEELGKALQNYATKKELRETVDQGIYILKILIEELRDIIKAGEERDHPYRQKIDKYEERISKIEDKMKYYP